MPPGGCRLADPLYRARRALHTGADLLTERQHQRLSDLFGVDERPGRGDRGIYQRMISAYREPDRNRGRQLMSALIESLRRGVPPALTELVTPGRSLCVNSYVTTTAHERGVASEPRRTPALRHGNHVPVLVDAVGRSVVEVVVPDSPQPVLWRHDRGDRPEGGHPVAPFAVRRSPDSPGGLDLHGEVDRRPLHRRIHRDLENLHRYYLEHRVSSSSGRVPPCRRYYAHGVGIYKCTTRRWLLHGRGTMLAS